MRVLRWVTVVLTLFVAGLGLGVTRSEAAALPTAGATAAGDIVREPIAEQAQYYYRRRYYRPYRYYGYRPYRRYYGYRPYRRYYYRPYYRRPYYRPRFYIGF